MGCMGGAFAFDRSDGSDGAELELLHRFARCVEVRCPLPSPPVGACRPLSLARSPTDELLLAGSFPRYAVSTGACDESGTRFVAKPVLKRQLVVAQHNSGWRSEVATRVCIVRRCMPVAVANVPLHTVLYHAAGQFATRSNTAIRLSAATAVCVRGKDESTPVERHKKARLARYRPLRVTTCHPQLDLCPLRACTLRARGTQGVLSLSPMRTVSVSFRRALAQWRNAGRHMWAPVEPTLLGHETGCLHQ